MALVTKTLINMRLQTEAGVFISLLKLLIFYSTSINALFVNPFYIEWR